MNVNGNGGGDRESRRRYDDDDRHSSRRHRGEYYDEDRDRRSSRNGYSSRRGDRDPYYYDYRGNGGGYHHDRYDRGYGGRRDDRRGRGGAGWRDGPSQEASSSIRRSPTPPGTRPISERVRKNSKWDLPPDGYESMTPMQAKATGLFGIPGQTRTLGVQGASLIRGAEGAASSGITAVPMAGSAAGGDASTNGAATTGATQANRQARRLYVGNIGMHASEDSLLRFFNDQMRKMNFAIEEGDPAIAAQVNGEKGYAFIELRDTREATNAMSFDGIIYQGQSIKIRRPKDYIGPDPHPPANKHVPGVISTNVPDGPNKIYIGGLPTYLVEDQVIELLKSFGDLRSFNLVREAGVNGASKGFAFCEYVDTNITDLAIQGLNDMELGDKKLLVQRASVGGTSTGQRTITGANAAPLMTGANGIGAGVASENLAGAGEPTKAMVLLNCVTAEELVDAQEYQEIVEDMRDECSRYGRVVDMRIPRPEAASKGSAAQSWKQIKREEEESSTEREGVGKVYVLFDDTQACQNALQAIAGRQFAGRTVIAAFISEDSFPSDEDGGRDAEETTKQATSL
ncbi:uncharacterized protein FA14DRAFT_127050 [Meira miltonrushii]|uniref:Splicing factor U2AF subunit n=1 Tax=Meira miltonrushii TaxID=1280837 RepID=A0A316V353_9BASI|nr:uncharacterized protein FA14DRAFT_127050 [Meira miltonrushii]PWN31986.1 hypothetical protein FA14DRAFT_127050 [Meira miltonrushii]